MVKMHSTASIDELTKGSACGNILERLIYTSPYIGATLPELKLVTGSKSVKEVKKKLETLLALNLVRRGEPVVLNKRLAFVRTPDGTRYSITSSLQQALIQGSPFLRGQQGDFNKKSRILEQQFIQGVQRTNYFIR